MKKYLGISIRRLPDANGKMWLTAVVWYWRGGNRLGYLYPAIRWL